VSNADHPRDSTLANDGEILMSSDLDLSLSSVADEHLQMPDLSKLGIHSPSTHPLRILLLYGSLRERSYSRLPTLEAERILRRFGGRDAGLRPP
jgi:arsenic resistance protein ArsH